jgi:cytochrome P450
MAFPPRVKLPASLQTLMFFRKPVEWLSRLRRKYGDIHVKNDLLFGVQVSFNQPELVKQVFTGDPKLYHAGEGNFPLKPIVGDRSVLLLDGDEHLGRRRLISPPFHGEKVQAHAGVMAKVTEDMLAQWRPGDEFSLYPWMQQLTLEMILRAVFGLGEGELLDEFRRRFTVLLDRIQSPPGILLLVPALQRDLGRLTPWAGFQRELGAVNDLVYAEITDRRARLADPDRRAGFNDVLSLMVLARGEDGAMMTDVEIHDDLMTLVIAGHESTATELCWAFAELLLSPEAQAKLVAELDEHAGALPAKIHELKYLDACVKEVLRLHPVIGNLGRRVKDDVKIDCYHIPKETIVSPSICMTHRREDLYPDPEVFRPERFLGKKTDPYTYYPFGGGTRRCVGATFAMQEMKVVIATVMSRVRLRSASPRPPKTILRSLAFSPAGGTHVVVEGPRRVD